jgi:drug/metabolite transporter (DMT)-like permease
VTRGTAAGGGAIAVWSLNAALAGVALDRLAVGQVLAVQFGAAFALVSVVKARRPSAPGWAAARLGAVGIAGTIALQYLAFATAPLVAANAIAYAWPLLIAAHGTLARGAPRRQLAFAAAGFAGVVLLLAARGGDSGGTPLGYLAAGASAVAMAAYSVRAAASKARTLDVLWAGTAAGTAVTVPLALGERWTPLWAVAVAAAIGVAMLGLGYGLWTVAMRSPAGPRIAPAAYLTPLLSTLVLVAGGHTLPPAGLAGCALIVGCAAGVVIPAGARTASRSPR